MLKRISIILGLIALGSILTLSVAADGKSPAFYFGGKEVRVGMPQTEVVAALSNCCKLTPEVGSMVEQRTAPAGRMLGHIILPKDESPRPILGAIFFSSGRVVRVTRPLADEVDTSNEDVVGFARAIKRSLGAEGNIETTAVVSVRHEQMSNAESDVVLITLKDGRGIEIHIGTLDKPKTGTDRRDYATLDETLNAPLP